MGDRGSEGRCPRTDWTGQGRMAFGTDIRFWRQMPFLGSVLEKATS